MLSRPDEYYVIHFCNASKIYFSELILLERKIFFFVSYMRLLLEIQFRKAFYFCIWIRKRIRQLFPRCFITFLWSWPVKISRWRRFSWLRTSRRRCRIDLYKIVRRRISQWYFVLQSPVCFTWYILCPEEGAKDVRKKNLNAPRMRVRATLRRRAAVKLLLRLGQRQTVTLWSRN